MQEGQDNKDTAAFGTAGASPEETALPERPAAQVLPAMCLFHFRPLTSVSPEPAVGESPRGRSGGPRGRPTGVHGASKGQRGGRRGPPQLHAHGSETDRGACVPYHWATGHDGTWPQALKLCHTQQGPEGTAKLADTLLLPCMLISQCSQCECGIPWGSRVAAHQVHPAY